MLIQFSVENHRVIRERASFDLFRQPGCKEDFTETAAKVDGGTHVGDAIETGHEIVPHALRDAVIFGGPGAGRTALASAMKAMQNLVAGVTRDNFGNDIERHAEPYVSASGSVHDAPTTFEAMFIKNGTLYEYGLSIKDEAVHREWLHVVPEKGEKRIRVFDNGVGKSGKAFRWAISKDRMNPEIANSPHAMKSIKHRGSVFLGKAERLNLSDDMNAAYDWIVNDFDPHPARGTVDDWSILTSWLSDDSDGTKKRRIIDFVNDAGGEESHRNLMDIVVNGRVHPLGGPPDLTLVYRGVFEDSEESKSRKAKIRKRSPVSSIHLANSSRTAKNLLKLAPHVVTAIDRGGVLVLDEVMEDIHTVCVGNIIDMFRDRHDNIKSAQLVFTSHDTAIVKHAEMNRDQVWIMNRDHFAWDHQGGALYPWCAFETEKGEKANSWKSRGNFASGYLFGVMGGTPSKESHSHQE